MYHYEPRFTPEQQPEVLFPPAFILIGKLVRFNLAKGNDIINFAILIINTLPRWKALTFVHMLFRKAGRNLCQRECVGRVEAFLKALTYLSILEFDNFWLSASKLQVETHISTYLPCLR